MDRRDFIRQMGLSLAAGWACARLAWPLKSWAAAPPLRLALLADAHLKSGETSRPEVQNLARAVAQINAMPQPPDLVLFAGDLAHRGRPDALDLGREILSDLAPPLWAVRGEGDWGRAGIAAWTRRFGPPRFCRTFAGVNFLGLDIPWRPTAHGPVFEMGPEQRTWLAGKLDRLDTATPLVIVSHSPLNQIFFPWQQWTQDAPEVAPLLSRFQQVICLHGHVHRSVASGQWPVASEDNDWRGSILIEKQKFKMENRLHLSAPATAWPLPAAVMGTPGVLRPAYGLRGCGWAALTLSPGGMDFRPFLWQV